MAGERYLPHFDVSISDNFGYVYTSEDAANVIKQYEVSSVSSFVLQKRRASQQIPGRGHGNRVYWEDVAVAKYSVPAAAIKFDGVPYCYVSTTVYECHHGKDWKEKYKAQKKEMRKKASTDENGQSKTKSRVCLQPTKKLDCPAQLVIRQVVKYPAFKITSDTSKDRKAASKALRKALTDNGTKLQGERRYYIYLPTVDDHKGTHGIAKDDADAQRLDPSIIKKIHEVVSTLEVRTVSEMARILRDFVKHDLGMQPLPTEDNRRFYPRHSDIRYHIYMARNAIRKCSNDQENLETLINEWKEADSEGQQFYFRKHKEGQDNSRFLFVHQTSWQREILSKYGQEICLLDAASKTTQYFLPIFFVAVKTNSGYITIGTFITQDEETESIKEALDILKNWNADWSPKYFMTDCADQEISSIEAVFPDCCVLICDLYRTQAWERWTNRGENGSPTIRDEILGRITRMAEAGTVEEFAEAVDSLLGSSIWQSHQRFRDWFEKEWLPYHQRWAWAFRQGSFLMSVNINSGIHQLHHALKDEFVRNQQKQLPLSQMVRALVHELLPDSWETYQQNNCSKKDGADVPSYLLNRPQSVVRFCMEQMRQSNALQPTDVEDVGGNTFNVSSGSRSMEHHTVTLDQPCCTCNTWIRNGLPCEHMFAVFAHTPSTWLDLPEHYRESPFLNRDSLEGNVDQRGGVGTEHPSDYAIGDIPEVAVEYRDIEHGVFENIEDVIVEICNTEHADQKVGLVEMEVEMEPGNVDHVDMGDVTKSQEQCRETLREIREYTFLCQNTEDLNKLNDNLRLCASELRQKVTRDEPSPQVKKLKRKVPFQVSHGRSSTEIHRKETISPLHKEARVA